MKLAIIGFPDNINLDKELISILKAKNFDLKAICSSINRTFSNQIKFYKTVSELLSNEKIELALIFLPKIDEIKSLIISKIDIIISSAYWIGQIELSQLQLLSQEYRVKLVISPIIWQNYENELKNLMNKIGTVYSIQIKKKKDSENPKETLYSILSWLTFFAGLPKKIELTGNQSDFKINFLIDDIIVVIHVLYECELNDYRIINGSKGCVIIKNDDIQFFDYNDMKISKVSRIEKLNLEIILDEFLDQKKQELSIIMHINLIKLLDSVDFGKKENNVEFKKFDYDWPRISEEMENFVVGQMRESLSLKIDRSSFRDQFENDFKNYLNASDRYSVLTNSGCMAIFTMYRAIDLLPNDLVIVPVYTFHATVSPMMHYGAIPIFCDCDENGNIDPKKIREICSKLNQKPKAVIVTHMWGAPAKMTEIAEICKEHGMFLLEDCSHSHGASIDGKMTGTFGDAAAWSLQCQKILTGGEGGFLLLRTKDMYYKSLLNSHFNKPCFKNIEKSHELYKFCVTGTGLKLRIHPLAVAIVTDQLKHLKSIIETKNYFANKIVNGLKHIPFLRMPKLRSDSYSPSWYYFIMHFDQAKTSNNLTREIFCNELKQAGLSEIEIPLATILINEEPLFKEPHTILPHVYGNKLHEYKEFYEKYQNNEYDRAKNFYLSAIKLPVWGYLDQEQIVDRYVQTIAEISSKYF